MVWGYLNTVAVVVVTELVMTMAPVLWSVGSWLTTMVAPLFSILCSASNRSLEEVVDHCCRAGPPILSS